MSTTAPTRQGGITQTCLTYLQTGDFETFCSLVNYCRRAVGHLYFPSECETTISIKTEPGLKDGLPDIFADDADQRTTEWIQEWLLEFLLPYRNASPDELDEEAVKGTFRYIGRSCRLALIDRIRGAQPKNGGIRVRRMLENTVETDDGKGEPLINFVVRPEAIDPVAWIENHKKALQGKGIYEVCGSLAAQYLDRDRHNTARLAELWGICERQAQNRRRRVINRIRRELRNDPLIRELFEVISDWRDRRQMPILAVSPSPEAIANSKLLEEAVKEGREFYRWRQTSDETQK